MIRAEIKSRIDWLIDHREHLTKAELRKVRRMELYLPVSSFWIAKSS